MDDLCRIDQKIQELKKRKEQLQVRFSLSLMKEIQNILKDEFSPELVLAIISQSWNQASTSQKEEWLKASSNFRASSKTVSSDSKQTEADQQI